MQQNELERVQKTLVSALEVRYYVTSLLDLARKISLVSFNAKITSSQIGDAGRVFSVMTNEISDIANNLRETVTDIRKITHDWTIIIAQASLQMHRLKSLKKACNLNKEKKNSLVALEKTYVQTESSLDKFNDSYPVLLNELLRIIGGMEKSMKVVSYVRIGILIESERLSGSASIERSPFQHLANEMQAAADKIHVIAAQTTEQLQRLSIPSTKKERSYAITNNL